MKTKVVSVLAAAAIVAPTTASACDLYLNSTTITASRLALGVGAQIATGEHSGQIFSADLQIPLASRIVVAPSVGLCRFPSESPGVDDFSEIVMGGAAAVRLISTDKMIVNVQAGLARVSLGDDISEMVIPITGALQANLTDRASIYAGGGIQMDKVTDIDSDNDPVAFGGLNLMLSKLNLTGGVGLKFGDETDVVVNIGVKLPLGGN